MYYCTMSAIPMPQFWIGIMKKCGEIIISWHLPIMFSIFTIQLIQKKNRAAAIHFVCNAEANNTYLSKNYEAHNHSKNHSHKSSLVNLREVGQDYNSQSLINNSVPPLTPYLLK